MIQFEDDFICARTNQLSSLRVAARCGTGRELANAHARFNEAKMVLTPCSQPSPEFRPLSVGSRLARR